MQFRKPMVFLASLGLSMCLLQTLAAQQNSSNNTNSQATPGKSSGTSQTNVTAPPDPLKGAAAPLAGEKKPDTTASKTKADKGPFRVSVNEVIVPVTVTDEKGRFVSDLDQKDFHI